MWKEQVKIIKMVLATAFVWLCVMMPLMVTAEDGAAKIAEVNGVAISSQVFKAEVQSILERIAEGGQQPTQNQIAEATRAVFDKFVEAELLYQASQRQGVVVDAAAVDSEMETVKKQFRNEKEFQTALQQWGISENIFKQELTRNMTVQRFLEEEFINKTTVSDQESRDYYDANREKFIKPAQARASHILFKIDQETTEKMKDTQMARLVTLREKLVNGADFAELAKEFSDCPSSGQGGDLGYFGRGQMIKPFEDAVFAMQAGDLSNIVETAFGYHLIKVVERQDEILLEYGDVKEHIANLLKGQILQQNIRNYVASLKEQATIKSFLVE